VRVSIGFDVEEWLESAESYTPTHWRFHGQQVRTFPPTNVHTTAIFRKNAR